MGHLEDTEALIERLTEEIFIDALKNIQETGSTHDSKSMEIVSTQFYASVELDTGHTFSELPHFSQCFLF